MVDPTRGGEASPERPGRETPDDRPGRARWQVVVAILALVALVVVGILLVGGHGPGQHGASSTTRTASGAT